MMRTTLFALASILLLTSCGRRNEPVKSPLLVVNGNDTIVYYGEYGGGEIIPRESDSSCYYNASIALRCDGEHRKFTARKEEVQFRSNQ